MTSQKPRVLLLGDSIRLSYQPLVAEMLAGRADVVGPQDNGRFALYSLMRIWEWLGQFGRPDVIHWNNGLWDCSHAANQTPEQFPIADYLGNLRHLLGALRTTGARIIWATITPVDIDRRPPRPDARWWKAEELAAYNGAALAMMQAEGVAINDLGALVSPSLKTFICDDGVHLTDAGKQACAAAVAAAIEQQLAHAGS